jgi:hypothetical protein
MKKKFRGDKLIYLDEMRLNGLSESGYGEAVLTALDTLTWHYSLPDAVNKDIKLSEVAKSTNRLVSANLKVSQVEDLLKGLGFRVSYTHGIKYVRANPDLLERLT